MTSYAYLMTVVVLISMGQIFQKLAATQLDTGFKPSKLLLSLTRSGWFWLAIIAMGSGLLVWLLALSTIEVSKGYPILSLSFALTTCLSMLILDEQVNSGRWLGIGLISVGAAVMLVS